VPLADKIYDTHIDSFSTLRQFVAAMGGELEITARFPDGAIRFLQFEDAEAS